MKSFFSRIHREGFTWRDSFIIHGFITYVIVVVLEIIMTFSTVMVLSWTSGTVRDLLYAFCFYACFIFIWLVLILLCLIVKTNRPILRSFLGGLRGNTVPWFLLGLLLGFGLNALCVGTAVLNQDISVSWPGNILGGILYNMITVIIVAIQSGSEEILYRGYYYQRLRKGYKDPLFAILVNPIPFVLTHLFNPGVTVLALINIYVIGILLSMMVYYFDSLWFAIAFHSAWNYTQNVIFGLPVSGLVLKNSIGKMDLINPNDSFFYSVSFGVEGTGFFLVMGIILIFLIYCFGRKRKVRATDIWANDGNKLKTPSPQGEGLKL